MNLFLELHQYLSDNYRQVKFLCKLLMFLCALIYLGYHSVSGKNGYNSCLIIKKEIENKQKKLDTLTADFKKLKLKVDHLNSSALDLDLLEERCRVMLNYGYSDETIIRTSSIPY